MPSAAIAIDSAVRRTPTLPVMSFCTRSRCSPPMRGRLCRSRQRFTPGRQAIREQRTNPISEHQPLEQTVAGKPVGTVNSRACTLTDGK